MRDFHWYVELRNESGEVSHWNLYEKPTLEEYLEFIDSLSDWFINQEEDEIMKIELSSIKPSPKPIRTSWDDKALEDLRWSLMEEGQVEPVGVHESGDGYTLVWGHRRTEAARRAGWDDIEAVIVPQDEVNNLIQAGIENLAGEDMSADDKAEWATRLVRLGLSQREISRRSTVPEATIRDWLIVESEPEIREILRAGTHSYSQDEGVKKIKNIVLEIGDNLEDKKAVANKGCKR